MEMSEEAKERASKAWFLFWSYVIYGLGVAVIIASLSGCAAPPKEEAKPCIPPEMVALQAEFLGWLVLVLDPDQRDRFMARFNAEPPQSDYVASAVLIGYNPATGAAVARVFVDGCAVEGGVPGKL